MNQIITLLSNLFNLTKVASVTLPGLLSAAGLALILWPALPIDVIPAVVHVSHPRIMNITPDAGCPGETAFGWHDAYAQSCQVVALPLDRARQYLIAVHQGLSQQIQHLEVSSGSEEELAQDRAQDESLKTILDRFSDIDSQGGLPASRSEQLREQLVLDVEDQSFSECTELENSLKGREEAENDQLKADLVIEEQKRSAAQANYLAYLKLDNPLSERYKTEMNHFEECIALKRSTTLLNDQDSRERERRLKELARQQQVIEARLADPGRLRPRVGFDAFLTGLVNHLVGFILLSLASAIIVTAIDKAIFGALFEDLFDGF